MDLQSKGEHTLCVESCKKVAATAICSVDAFTPRQIVLSYTAGRIIVEGSGLKVVSFSQATGAFCAVGTIVSVRYAERSAKFLQRLLK